MILQLIFSYWSTMEKKSLFQNLRTFQTLGVVRSGHHERGPLRGRTARRGSGLRRPRSNVVMSRNRG